MSLRFFSFVLLAAFLSGCAGHSARVQQEKVIAQVQSQGKKSELQEKLLAQMGKTELTGFKDYAVGPEDLLEVRVYGQDDLNRVARVNGQGEITLPLVGEVKVAGLSPSAIESRLMDAYKRGRFFHNPQITVSVKEYRHQQVMVTGAVDKPGSYEMIGPRTLLEMVGKAGGLSEKAGDVVHVIRSESAAARTKALASSNSQSFSPGAETIIINLRRLVMGGDLRLNIPIRNGDVIHVPPAQSAFILGAVKKPCQVPVKDNLTVTQALAMAEGLDPLLASKRISLLRFNDQGERVSIPVDIGGVTAGTGADPVLKPNDIVFVHESGARRFLYNIRNLMPGAFSFGLAPAL
jgi:polysaccharide export outer membrane protein